MKWGALAMKPSFLVGEMADDVSVGDEHQQVEEKAVRLVAG